jgi:flagellar biosynthetic protein FliR
VSDLLSGAPDLDRFVLATVRLGPIVWTCGSVLAISNRRALLGATLLTSLALAPVIPAPAVGAAPVLVLRELAIGLTMAWVGRAAYVAVELAGQQIGRDMGLGEAETLLGEGGAGAGSLGAILLTWTVLAALLAAGGDLLVVRLVARSYELVPPGSRAPTAFGPAFAMVLDGACRAAWVAALPGIGVSIAVVVGLGLIGRAAPQINAYVASYPLRIGLVLVVVLVATPVMGRPLVRFGARAVRLTLEAIAG